MGLLKALDEMGRIREDYLPFFAVLEVNHGESREDFPVVEPIDGNAFDFVVGHIVVNQVLNQIQSNL